jgi:DNA-binding transcriptional regulator/RsmH inhibitor MraZ
MIRTGTAHFVKPGNWCCKNWMKSKKLRIMTTPNVLFAGNKSVRLDSSLRLCIPADWRQFTGDLLYLLFSRRNGHPVIKVITRSSYDEKIALIMSHQRMDAQQKALMVSRLEHLIREVRLDKRNRMSIPSDLGEILGLEKPGEAMLVGCGNNFEIWRPEDFESFMGEE